MASESRSSYLTATGSTRSKDTDVLFFQSRIGSSETRSAGIMHTNVMHERRRASHAPNELHKESLFFRPKPALRLDPSDLLLRCRRTGRCSRYVVVIRWANRQSGTSQSGLAWWYEKYSEDTSLRNLQEEARLAKRAL
jgi:hypothetical protein